jgi:hypothetical protein
MNTLRLEQEASAVALRVIGSGINPKREEETGLCLVFVPFQDVSIIVRRLLEEGPVVSRDLSAILLIAVIRSWTVTVILIILEWY